MTPYTKEDWNASAEHRPLRTLPLDQVLLLHRHWMWANQERELFDTLLAENPERLAAAITEDGVGVLAHRLFRAMFLWYALLYSVIEACLDPGEGRELDIRGPLRADIDAIRDALRRFRNAVFHVSPDAYADKRLLEIITNEEVVSRIRRMSPGLGRLFHEELTARGEEQTASP